METYFDERTGKNLIVRPDAYVYKNVFQDDYFNELKDYLLNLKNNHRRMFNFDENFGRLTYHTDFAPPDCMFRESLFNLVPLAKEIFKDDTLEASYGIFSAYKGYKARLYEHIDDNACTYTIDLGVQHIDSWPLVVEGKEFTVEPNDAIIYYGEDQYHWRPVFPNPKTNEVCVIFYHFVGADHWSRKFGRQYHQTVKEEIDRYRNQIT